MKLRRCIVKTCQKKTVILPAMVSAREWIRRNGFGNDNQLATNVAR